MSSNLSSLALGFSPLMQLSHAGLGAGGNHEARELQSLDGTWEIVFDSQNEGRKGAWHQEQVFSAHDGKRRISVPSCWEEIERDYEGVAYYGRRFPVPETWNGKTIRLRFEAVNYIAEVWVNDRVAGKHEGGYGPFELRVDELLKYGEDNFLSLRVLGPIVAENKVIDGIGQSDMPHWRGAIAGGIWQSVQLIATGTVFVEDIMITPRLADNTANIQVTLENSQPVSQGVTVEVLLHAAGDSGRAVVAKSAPLELVPGRNEKSWTVTIPEARYWSPDDPHLYTATVRIANKTTPLDVEEVRFGMRELTIRNRKFELNGEPIYIKAAFFEGLYPTKLALPDSEAMARREIRLAKECGFNMIRPWRKPPPPRWLDLCDEMGVMIIGGLPLECMNRWPTVTPFLRARVENEVRSAVMRDRNRACIVQWEIFNEIGYGSLPDLVDNNKRFARDGNPLVPPYRYHREMAESIRGVLVESGLDAVYPDLQRFCHDQQAIHSQANKRMLEAIRSNSSTGGYAVHALTGGDWVLGAGLLDLFRNPKGSYWGTREANQPRYLALRVRPRNIYATRGARITITGINDLADRAGMLLVEVVPADGASVLRTEKDVSLVSGISPLFEQTLVAGRMEGSYTVRARLTGVDGAVVAQNSVAIDVFTDRQLAVPKAQIAVLDSTNSLRPFLVKAGLDFIEFSADTPRTRPVLVGRIGAINREGAARFEALAKFVQRGGTAVYLEAVQRGANPFWGQKLPPGTVLPVQATLQSAKGLWVGVSHVVTDHAVFKGLPSKGMMGQAYENVWAPQTLMGTGGELIVGSVSHGWYQGQKDSQHYQGPSAAWYGMDMGVVPSGRGRYVLSALRLLENLGADPVADMILFNLINWLARSD